MTDHLQTTTLSTLPADVSVPKYDRSNTDFGIVHLGVGAFHRCHQAVYTEEVLNKVGGDWAIIGVCLRSADTRDAMASQDYLYSVASQDYQSSRYQVVGAIKHVLVAPESPSQVFEVIASLQCKVVTLTITEKGYCLDPASGLLDKAHPEIVHDLQSLDNPKTALGYLAAGLRQRFDNGMPGITLLSCDNLRHNGEKLKAALLAFSEAFNPALAQWISNTCTFPSSMVDRIVPAATDATFAAAKSALQVLDSAALRTELFSQWVIEDNFASARPPWDKAGAQFVKDVTPYEEMKLRLLNGSHSTLAYAGALSGYETVADAIGNPAYANMIQLLMQQEMTPTLPPLEGFDVVEYQQQLLKRFRNPHLHHKLHQIAVDGSQKIPQRMIPALLWQVHNNKQFNVICFAIAAWISFTWEVSKQDSNHMLSDPMAESLRTLAQQCQSDSSRYLKEVLNLDTIFPKAIQQHNEIRTCLSDWFDKITQQEVPALVNGVWGENE